jgi:hypothetical protein
MFTIAAVLAASGTSLGQAIDEYRVKAGFVAAFTSFVEWPPESFTGPSEPYRICILGRNPFGKSLDELVETKIVAGRKLSVRSIAEVREREGCHILFISSSEHLRLKAILDTSGKEGVLTVGDTSDFIAEGGIVNLSLEGGRVRMEINPDAAKERHLRISSRLLQLAKCVKR